MDTGRDLEKAGGRDWEHFATGLGLHLAEQEEVRVRQGEVDNIEREEGGNTIKIVKRVIELFGQRCATAGVSEDIGEHMAKVLESHDVFEPPLRFVRKLSKSLILIFLQEVGAGTPSREREGESRTNLLCITMLCITWPDCGNLHPCAIPLNYIGIPIK